MKQKQPPQARKRPRQSRARHTMRAIQEACLRILDNEGADRLTTGRIAEVAGVNIASLYQYFPNKEAILADVYEARVQELAAQAASRFEDIQRLAQQSVSATFAAIIEMECEQLIALQQLDPDFFREYQNSFDIHQRIDSLTQSLDNPSWEDWLGQWLTRQGDTDNPQLRSLLLRQTLQGNLRQTLMDQPALLAESAYREELLKLLLCYLGEASVS